MLPNFAPLLMTFLWLWLRVSILSEGTATDIACLKSLKESLVDTHNYLNYSWDFSNQTEGFICTFLGVECWHAYENRVLNIRLSDLGLEGEFPLGLQNCISLQLLDLSYNKLSGPIPKNISDIFPYLTILELSFNNFSGEIPASIANCSFLNVLKLDHNKLTGLIPSELALHARLKEFSVANNLLTGPLPSIIPGNIYFTNESYANNPGLCGGPLEPCGKHRNVFATSFKKGFMTGFLIAAVSTVTVFLSYCVPWVQVNNRKNKITIITMAKMMMAKNRKRVGKLRVSSIVDILHESKEISMLEKRVTRMSYTELTNATDNFSEKHVIGQGKMGILYKATMDNGYVVAVKKLHDSEFLEEQFISELKILGSLRHFNLLPLLGFCIHSKQRFLVYKYMPNGNLYDWLHPNPMKDQVKIMGWVTRVKVAIGLARGLVWLHRNCQTIRVIHLDISSKCILLDQDFQPKLSNFGEAILTNSTDDSEFWETEFVKEDVHGLGIVLFELIIGLDVSNITGSSNSILNEWVSHLLSPSGSKFIDKSLIGQGYDAEIFQLFKVACNCVHSIPDERPTMLQVYNDVKAIREIRCGQLFDDSEIQMQPEITPCKSQ